MEPIAKRLNQSAEATLAATAKKKQADDIAEQIKRLEAELEHGSDGSSSESSDEEDDDECADSDASSEASEPQPSKKAPRDAVLSLSAYANERVEALPEHLLPKATATAANLSEKKRKRETEAQASLLDAVQWAKRVPFACKPCAFVGKNLEEFHAHRESPEHLARHETVDSVLMCKLCDKKFTSPQQLADHKLGKWHLQRTQQRKERHVVKVCYDFMRGACKWGDRCSFEHTETKAMKKGKVFEKTKKRTCETFAKRGRCKYGAQCMFSHDAS